MTLWDLGQAAPADVRPRPMPEQADSMRAPPLACATHVPVPLAGGNETLAGAGVGKH